MWLRLVGAVAITLIALGVLEYFGLSRLFGAAAPDEAPETAHSRSGELFWLFVFAVVMATSLLAALRRWAGHLRRAVARER